LQRRSDSAMFAPFRQAAPSIGCGKDANVVDLPGSCGAGPDQRRRLMIGPNRSLVDVEPASESVKYSRFPFR
jgi:hypothetical protein